MHLPADAPGGAQVQGHEDAAARSPSRGIQQHQRPGRLLTGHQLFRAPAATPGGCPSLHCLIQQVSLWGF